MGPIKRVFQMCSYVRGPISCNWELFEGWLPISVSSITWFLEVSSFWIILNDSVWFQILFRTNGYPPLQSFFLISCRSRSLSRSNKLQCWKHTTQPKSFVQVWHPTITWQLTHVIKFILNVFVSFWSRRGGWVWYQCVLRYQT